MRLRARWRRHAADAEPLVAQPPGHAEACHVDVRHVADLTDRETATVVGVVRRTTVAPPGKALSLRAELADGDGALELVWLGRRAIAGIEAGVALRVHGLACVRGGGAMMYNPRYEILPTAPEEHTGHDR